MATATIPTAKLSNGVEMPVLGFGVLQIPAEETEQAVAAALEVGYRSLDTARSSMNEEAVGRGIASSCVPRDELFITTRLCGLRIRARRRRSGRSNLPSGDSASTPRPVHHPPAVR